MGEVNNMKKVISVVMCVVMLLCCACFAGCGNNSNSKKEDIKNALVNAGYDGAYVSGTHVNLGKDKSGFIDLNDDGVFDLIDSDEDDVPKVLNAVMPLFSDRFADKEGDIIFEALKRSRTVDEDGRINGGKYSGAYYEYKEIYFNDSNNLGVGPKIDIRISPK